IEVDGSYGEAGGQIFRMALALSSLAGEDVRVMNIRAGRPKPGLARQHITAAKAVASVSSADADGLQLGSSEVVFRPGTLTGGRFELDVGTAGSVTLVLQACLLPALFARAPTELRIRGGTDVRWSPPSDYFQRVFLRLLERMGIHVEMRVLRRGYYPRGGGLVEARIEPVSSVAGLRLSVPGQVVGIRGRAHVSNLPQHVAQRMKRSALRMLVNYREVHVEEVVYGGEEAVGPGGAVVLWAVAANTILGSSRLAEKGVRAEDVGRGAAEDLQADLEAGATLDVHAADQLLPYMALATSSSHFLVREVSGHMRTLFWLLSKFLDVEFSTEDVDGLKRVEVKPIRT
ncbi:MAG: RNA 3'-terminal phosphate cyclase, partial [Thermoplasmata archaeon]